MASTSTARATSPKVGAIAFTAVAAVLAALTGWALSRVLSAGGYNREPLRPVVVAKRAVGAGHPLQEEDLKVVPWPVSAIPEGAFDTTATLLRPQPAVPTSGFAAGEPIMKERLASPDAGPGLAALVQKESRAVTIQIDRALAVSRLIYPGAHVDVLVTVEDRMKGLVSTRTLLEDLRVLAVGTFADVDAARRGAEPNKATVDAEAVVTIEVTPADAEKLALSARQGKLDLALRNATDHSHITTPGIALAELITPPPAAGSEPAAAAAAPSPASRRRVPTAATTVTPPVVKSNPRRPGSDEKSGSTIEVYSVPTQTR